MRLNRMLLEDAYPDRIKRREFFTDVTAANAKGGAKIPLLPRTDKTDPRLYLGSNTIFDSLRFTLSKTGKGYALEFRYFDGKQKGWVKLTKEGHGLDDKTLNLRSNGTVTFTPPPDWTPTVLNNAERYWLSVSTSTPPTEVAEADLIVRDLTEKVSRYLEPRRLLTTRLHVVGARYVNVAVHLTLHLKADAVQTEVAARAQEALQEFFDPLRGGPEKTGWPFGRDVYVSEVYALLDRLPGVDYVTRAKDKNNQPYPELTVSPSDAGRIIESGGVMEGIRLEPDELVAFISEQSHLQMIDPKVDISRPLLESLKKQ